MGETSILNSTKKVCGLAAEYTAFDPDMILFINGVFSTLNDLGIGPNEGFEIEDADAVWSDYLGGDKRLNSVKNYMYLRVRLLFDPPTTSYLMDAMNAQIKELEWRITALRDNIVNAMNPLPSIVNGGGVSADPMGSASFDGGSP